MWGGGGGGGAAAGAASYQEHAERLPHDAVEQVQGRVPRHHEEVGQEQELPAAVVQQRVVLAAEQRLVRVLGEGTQLPRAATRGRPRPHLKFTKRSVITFHLFNSQRHRFFF